LRILQLRDGSTYQGLCLSRKMSLESACFGQFPYYSVTGQHTIHTLEVLINQSRIREFRP
jgi:hypothetical protein